MWRKIRSGFLILVLFSFLMLARDIEAQLNFSTGWGKRSQSLRTETLTSRCSQQGRPSSLEQLLHLYRLIQIEAQRIADCRKVNE